jgi:hypothetical protein
MYLFRNRKPGTILVSRKSGSAASIPSLPVKSAHLPPSEPQEHGRQE